MNKRQRRNELFDERNKLARHEHEQGRRPIDNQRISELDVEIERLSEEIAADFEASADLSQLQSEERVTIPKSVFDLIMLHFESGLSRAEQLRIAADSESLPHLAAIKLHFDR